jgi:U3 small nucleolar RNA-associated protein 12
MFNTRIQGLHMYACAWICAGAVTALRFSRDGALLASGSADTTLVVWDVVGETGLCRFKGHKDAITDLVGRRVCAAQHSMAPDHSAAHGLAYLHTAT